MEPGAGGPRPLALVVTAGGLTEAGRWQAAKKSRLLPGKVLMIACGGKLLAELLKVFAAPPSLALPRPIRYPQWFARSLT